MARRATKLPFGCCRKGHWEAKTVLGKLRLSFGCCRKGLSGAVGKFTGQTQSLKPGCSIHGFLNLLPAVLYKFPPKFFSNTEDNNFTFVFSSTQNVAFIVNSFAFRCRCSFLSCGRHSFRLRDLGILLF